MAYVYTPLFTDTFHRADEEPLNPADWTNNADGFDDLAVVSDLCVDAENSFGGWEFANQTLPNDQYAEATIESFDQVSGDVQVYLRLDIPIANAYEFVDVSGGTVSLENSDGDTLASPPVPGGTVNPGDVIHIEAIGQTVNVLYNGVQILTAVDPTMPASGNSGLFVLGGSSASASTVSKFVTGRVTTPPPSR